MREGETKRLNFKDQEAFPLLHHSITPAYSCTMEIRLKPSLGQLKVGSFGPGFFTRVMD
jgi:hypothetical protein